MKRLNLAGELVWIPGGSSGIGLACAKACLRLGAEVAISGRSREKLQAIRAELANERLSGFPCDVTSEESVRNAHAALLKHHGRPVSILINSAGLSPFDSFTETTLELFDEVIAANLTGLFLTSRAVLSGMYAEKSGTIVQLLSIASTKAFKGGAAYVASKFGGLGFTNALREEAREHGVKVVAVLPGATVTPLWSEEMLRENAGRMIQAEDVAEMIVDVLLQPASVLTEEITLRPIGGDL